MVAAVAAGGAAVAGVRRPADPPPPAASSGGVLAPPDAVVRDGDRVHGNGLVLALPGRPVRLREPRPAGRGVVREVEQAPAYCDYGLTLIGADLDRLHGRRELYGAVWGEADVAGTYRDRTVTVTAQFPSPAAPAPRATYSSFALPADCPAPPAGWREGPRRPCRASTG